MNNSKSSNENNSKKVPRNETVIEIFDPKEEKEIKSISMVENSEPCCSWRVMSAKPSISKSEPTTSGPLSSTNSSAGSTPEPSTDVIGPTSTSIHGCQSSHIELNCGHPRSYLLEENHISSSPMLSINEPAFDTAPPVYPEVHDNVQTTNPPNHTTIQVLEKREPILGPPPSYSKSTLDRRINPCASTQFVAPIPPPSYDGVDNDLRYNGYSGFTLGLGNTWQSQPQPAYCPICETVIITQVDVKVSKVAHAISIIMFFMLCWPFCLLPYFLNVCNFTFHYCSVCHCYLGARRPFQRT